MNTKLEYMVVLYIFKKATISNKNLQLLDIILTAFLQQVHCDIFYC